jgi:hypothetical protein
VHQHIAPCNTTYSILGKNFEEPKKPVVCKDKTSVHTYHNVKNVTAQQHGAEGKVLFLVGQNG